MFGIETALLIAASSQRRFLNVAGRNQGLVAPHSPIFRKLRLATFKWRRHALPEELRELLTDDTSVETPRTPGLTTHCYDEELPASKKKYSIRSVGDLREHCTSNSDNDYLVKGFLPKRSLGLIVGDSGLGKSPLCYQMALCVAAGRDFLGFPVQQGRVLYLDFENGLQDALETTERLMQFLNIRQSEISNTFLTWNLNDCSPEYYSGDITPMIKAVKPQLVIVDSLTGYSPQIEEKNSLATQVYQGFRKTMRACGCAFFCVHHLKKPSDNPRYHRASLEDDGVKKFLRQARGASALINASDVRIGMDEATAPGLALENLDLVFGGFGRIRGELPLTYLRRIFDVDGDAIGYEKAAGADLLPDSQRQAFEKLPDTFKFKEAKAIYGRDDQPTSDFLKKCMNLGILRQPRRRGSYEKVKTGRVTGESIRVLGESVV